MTGAPLELPAVLAHSPVRVVFGAGQLDRLGDLARGERAQRVLLVSDPGIAAAGYVDRAAESLRRAGLHVTLYDGAHENPTTEHVAVGVAIANEAAVDFLVGLGGGSAMDCCKGINLLCTNGGEMKDYWGINKAARPMLPSILVPTTAGTGSEAQSFALISDAGTHQKMACGDRRDPREGGLRPRVAILDPALTRTMPRQVAAATGIDAVAHAVETAGCKARTETSRACSRLAWDLLVDAYEPALRDPDDDAARAHMLLGAHLAGVAIEHSMLGAAHACANPLTARFGVMHGLAVGLMLPHVVRFNSANGSAPYGDLIPADGDLDSIIHRLLQAGGIVRSLRELGVSERQLPDLAEMAAGQWTAAFNPRQVGPAELLEIYQAALD